MYGYMYSTHWDPRGLDADRVAYPELLLELQPAVGLLDSLV